MPQRLNHIKAQLADCQKQHQQKDQLVAYLEQYIVEQHQREEQHLYTIEWKNELLTEVESENTELKEMNVQLGALNAQQGDMIADLNDTVAEQQKEIEKGRDLQNRLDEKTFELKMLTRHMYGHRSEKHYVATVDENGDPVKSLQLSLGLEAEAWGICQLTKRQKIEFIRNARNTTPKKPGGRHAIPDDLPEEINVIYPDFIPEGSKCVGHKDQILIACDPLRWYKKINRRMVYMAVAEDEITHKELIGPLPPHPIPRCKLDISVLVMMVIDKYLYHMPLWRQRRRFLQHGLELDYGTMTHDVAAVARLLEPLAHLLLREIMISRLVQFDETKYRVLDNSKKKGKKSHIGWMWVAMNRVQRTCCFMYARGRGKTDIAHVLKGYEGFLFTDAHKAYIKYGKQKGVEHGKCIGHSRRYFDQSLQQDHSRSAYALENFFATLYLIEEECKILKLDYDQITDKRQQESVPVLMAMKQWLYQELPNLTPRTPIYKAVSYALNHFDGMMVYTREGALPMDNNELEQEIRAIALGRNAYMFAGSHRSGELAATLYSLIATCKLQGIDPSVWMRDVLQRINAHPRDKLIQLLPQFWKPPEVSKALTG